MDSFTINEPLVRKYNLPVPRYTSYPTVPFWTEGYPVLEWREKFRERFSEVNHSDGIALYLHLPFCESLCTYCGCNKKITTNHKVEEEYIDVILQESKIYRALMQETPVIRAIHLGGGTPTFFSPDNLKRLINGILKGAIVHPKHEFSIEGHPNNTTRDHLDALYALGFRRISYGVQDLDPEVQRVINRIQPFENVRIATDAARLAGFRSVNFDLIYGLPLQKLSSITETFQKVLMLQPDRIAFYSYANVPWTSKAQRLFSDLDLPSADDKLQLYLRGKELLLSQGYADIGMDHFALPGEDLYKAWKKGKLHRNFMGYTTMSAGLLLGLGVSSISDVGNAFAQNEKTLHDYYARIRAGAPAIHKGYSLSDTDIRFRQYIMDIACKGETRFHLLDAAVLEEKCFPELELLEHDGLVLFDHDHVALTDLGHYFMRNVCSVFDLYLKGISERKQMFSKAI
jgi:oxygen-independent coproporphyrinogen III oxidase